MAYFLGRDSTRAHRLQRTRRELTFAPHLGQRRAWTFLVNDVRGRNLPMAAWPFWRDITLQNMTDTRRASFWQGPLRARTERGALYDRRAFPYV